MAWSRSSSLRELEVSEKGYQTYPYVIDAHTHLHRHVPKEGEKPFKDHFECGDRVYGKENWEFIPTKTLIDEMNRYGVDKAIVHCAMYTPLEELAKRIREYPDRLIGFCWFSEIGTGLEISDPDKAAEHLDEALNRPEFKGVGEGLLFVGKETWPETIRWLEPSLEVMAKHGVPWLMHTGPVGSYRVKFDKEMRKKAPKCGILKFCDPILVDDLAQLFPEVTFIIGHIGVMGSFFYGSFSDHALMVAATHDNVYLDTSSAPPEVIEKAIADPAVGAEKLVFGSDFGSVAGEYVFKGKLYPSYKERPHPEQSGYRIKRALDILHEVTMPEEERRLILGQNISRLIELD